jgi:hypothetical protein
MACCASGLDGRTAKRCTTLERDQERARKKIEVGGKNHKKYKKMALCG